MKNLANCKPSEFLTQTNKIRKSVGKWLADTDAMNIRKRVPHLTEEMSDEEKQKALEKQVSENSTAILDAIMEEHPQETLELLALLCFVEPENVDDHEVVEYLEAFQELLSNQAVLNFFMSLMRWVNQIT